MSRVARRNARFEIHCPTTTATARNSTALPITHSTETGSKATPRSAASMMPATTASTIRPITSSITAAPRMIRPSLLAARPRSVSTRAVMPTLVAVSVAPTNQCVSGLCEGKNHCETKKPSTIGVTTPSSATRNDEAPTAIIFFTSDSSPTWKSRNSTPIWARMEMPVWVRSESSPS